MSGETVSHILDSRLAFDGALHEIAHLRNHRDEKSHDEEGDEVFFVRQRRIEEEFPDKEQKRRSADAADNTADTADNRLIRTDFGGEFFGEFLMELTPEREREYVRNGRNRKREHNQQSLVIHVIDDDEEVEKEVRINERKHCLSDLFERSILVVEDHGRNHDDTHRDHAPDHDEISLLFPKVHSDEQGHVDGCEAYREQFLYLREGTRPCHFVRSDDGEQPHQSVETIVADK